MKIKLAKSTIETNAPVVIIDKDLPMKESIELHIKGYVVLKHNFHT